MWSSVLSQYLLIVVFLSWTDKQKTSVSSGCKSLRRLSFVFYSSSCQIPAIFFPLERVCVAAIWALGWVDHWVTLVMRWAAFSQAHIKAFQTRWRAKHIDEVRNNRFIFQCKEREMVKSIFGFFLVVHFWIQYTGLRVRTETLISGRSHLDSSLFSRSSRCRWVDRNMMMASIFKYLKKVSPALLRAWRSTPLFTS